MPDKKTKPKKEKKVQPPATLANPLKNEMPNYQVYVMTRREWLFYAVAAFVVGGLVSQVFYGGLFCVDGEPTTLTLISNAFFFIAAGVIAVKIAIPVLEQRKCEQRKLRLSIQFRDMLESITTSLSSGDTVSQAMESAYEDVKMQYGESSDMAKELEQILLAPQVGGRMEDMIAEFAARSGIEDIQSFSSVFSVCYATGGNMKDVMRRTHSIITEKMAIAEEIRSKLSANKIELNVITVAPVALMILMRTTNEGFAQKFSTPVGVLAITVAIVMFVVAYRMGQKITRVEV